ncbi:Hypothetical protein SMAX5B_007856 [Scophthalmus maximus]|uniref:Uncharacterized protein n=1 Tax=Scophthalmus maximus TaxID=52904 RepID=A0A2U9C4L3_SCOMX|nr:Hypothetical protein SMAX5B_007856 [Scophthalmus maximus]
MPVPLPRPISRPAEGLMKAQGHLVQTAHIHQRSGVSNGKGWRGAYWPGQTGSDNTSAVVLLVERFGP